MVEATALTSVVAEPIFERAAETECSDEKYKAGVEMILKQFKDALDKMNVKIIDPTGEPFDPATANAVLAAKHHTARAFF